MSVTLTDVRLALDETIDSNNGLSLGALIKDQHIRIDGARVEIKFDLGYHCQDDGAALKARLSDKLASVGVTQATIALTTTVMAHAIRAGVERVPQVKNIIAIASGKGGVGKSTTAVNLALAMASQGARVGVLDADIYGPSVPMILGVSGKPESDGKQMQPLLGHGIQTNSIGFLISPDSPAIWRGPMVTQALEQLLRQTAWADLDYLIVDMPPGTGDIALTLAQKVPVVGAIIVTTPQDVALLDARKGLRMFEKVEVPILGIIENMAVHVCSNCGHPEHIFGDGGGQRMAQEFATPCLGSLPLSIAIRTQSDAGVPIVIAQPDSLAAGIYQDIALKIAARVATLPRDLSEKFGTIAVKRA
jgi:ATP-binding protein involved in chromosome partitioning